jgi:hypothetical protein
MGRRPKPETFTPKNRDDLEARAALLKSDRDRARDALHEIADGGCQFCAPVAKRALGEA